MNSVDTGTLIMNLLESAFDYVSDHLADLSNQAVDGGQFDWDGADGLSLQTWNTDNHQQTWGVLKAAIEALIDYMDE